MALALFLAAAAGVPAAGAELACADHQSPGECHAAEIVALDRQIAQAHSGAASRLDKITRDRLNEDHAAFLLVRKAKNAGIAFDLGVQMAMRRDFLNAIVKPKDKWIGQWANATGIVDVVSKPAGTYSIRVSAAEPSVGTWFCEFEDAGMPAGPFIIAGAKSAALAHGGPNEGWTVVLRRVGDALLVDALPPHGKEGRAPFCRGGGGVAGAFFAQGTPGVKQ